jgi:DNA-binding transcriptional MerR regulator/methylmalonyl-CoA mutase cobalamin-binding subunit
MDARRVSGMAHRSEGRHPIGVVAERTGLSPDVLRVWERRYGVVEPTRSAGGQRVYSDADIERLTLLHRATRGGHGIGQVAALGRAKLESLVREVESLGAAATAMERGSSARTAIDRATERTRAFDAAGLEAVLRMGAARRGMVGFIDDVAAPFLRDIGDAWHAGELTISQEHLATDVVQRVVRDMAPSLAGVVGEPTIVIGTLSGERHAGGALMAAATAASAGWRVIYLGADLPGEEIAETAVRTRSRAVGISVVYPEQKSRTAAALRTIERAIPSGTTLFVGGAGAPAVKPLIGTTQIVFAGNVSELEGALSAVRARG